MFYSQFILAKKGPLGTIWIAAHLERKLRKNQVADTDIGVSVDSILFPEVPIALRLSSHLLLGVVRIYSRKVNYLFDDCSEALLKIKQAFRSTAVDLPPEESTAPYHSITLPETFDLDDFELPDSELFQGNYVDHHVSSREQITLQDNMDNVAYPSSRFGLDERFGDGDTSQIGLDLEEEILLVKAAAPGRDGVIKTAQDLDEPVVKEEPSNLEAMPEDGNGDQIYDLDEASEFVDYAQAPATPGLVEVPNLSNVKERLAFDDHMESEDHHVTAVAVAECGEDISPNLDLHPGYKSLEDRGLSNELNHDSLACMPHENGCNIDETMKDQTKSPVSSPSNIMSAGYKLVDGNKVEDEVIVGTDCMNKMNPEGVESPSCSNVTFDLEDPSRRTCSSSTCVLVSDRSMENENDGASLNPESHNDAETTTNVEGSHIPSKETTLNAAGQLESPSRATVVDDETQACLDFSYKPLNKSFIHEEVSSVDTHTIKPCNTQCGQQNNVSHEGDDSAVLPNLQSDVPEQFSMDNLRRENELNAFEASIEGQGEGCRSQMSEPDFCGNTQVDGWKSDERRDNVIFGDSRIENSNNCGTSELPAPEKLLSVPEALLDRPNDLLVEATPDKEVPAGDDGIGAITKAVSGRKRSYTESTLTMESINSVESFGGARSKRAAECIPDDDDLLSSILGGRRSSVLKMKTTPAFEVASKKRVRSVTRTSSVKRKVLLDEMMVLHGDAIRQQLTSTEDICRVRKKAPCTRREISMIQRQFLEDEIFCEPIFCGMSLELGSLHSGIHDLSRIRISECEDNHPPKVPNEVECSAEPKVAEENGIDDSFMQMYSNDAQAQSDGTVVQTKTQLLDFDIGTQQRMNSGPDVPHSLEGENLEVTEMDVDKRSAEAADAENMFGMDEMMNLTNPVITDFDNIFYGETQIVDASQANDALYILPDQQMSTQVVKESTTILGLSNGDASNPVEALNHIVDNTLVESKSIAGGANLYEKSRATLADIPADAHQGYSVHIGNECGFPLTSLEGNQGLNEEKQDLTKEDIVLAARSELTDQGSTFNGGEEPKVDSINPVEPDVCGENTSTNAIENQEFLGMTAVHMGIDAHGHPIGENHGGFEDVAVANDTDFLNLDDDEVGDDDNDEMPSTEDRQLLENSGWSSRTRAVARYLQNLFDNENVHGWKVLSTDSLLTGKTRKEAARMFFETLVLKTKDYIHVEQVKALDDINIKPRSKLMKSIF